MKLHKEAAAINKNNQGTQMNQSHLCIVPPVPYFSLMSRPSSLPNSYSYRLSPYSSSSTSFSFSSFSYVTFIFPILSLGQEVPSSTPPSCSSIPPFSSATPCSPEPQFLFLLHFFLHLFLIFLLLPHFIYPLPLSVPFPLLSLSLPPLLILSSHSASLPLPNSPHPPSHYPLPLLLPSPFFLCFFILS